MYEYTLDHHIILKILYLYKKIIKIKYNFNRRKLYSYSITYNFISTLSL